MMRKMLLVLGICVVLLVLAKLLGLFSPHSAPAPPPTKVSVPTAPTTWTITLDTTSGSIKYDVLYDPDSDHGGCQYATNTPKPNPKNLVICQNDIVRWQGTTPGQEHDLIVFMTDHLLSQITFIGKDGKTTNPQGLATATPDGNWHDWYVVVCDRHNKVSHHDDPKIKIGG
jgi:hypothetical protein